MRNGFIRKLPALLALLVLAGCAAPQLSKPRLFWPPDNPKLEYIGFFSSDEQFARRGLRAFADVTLGRGDTPELGFPYDVVTDGQGLIYVSDLKKGGSLIIFDTINKEVRPLQSAVGLPFALALDKAGNLYVAEGRSASVLVFDKEHRQRPVIGKERLSRPVGLALDERLGRLYVSDTKERVIKVFALADGQLLFEFGNTGEPADRLYGPQGMAIDQDNRVFVADTLNARIHVFDAEGVSLYTFGVRGDLPHQLEMPRDLAFDSQGHLHVIDARKGSLISFTPDGQYLLATGAGGPSTHEIGFQQPTGIFIDAHDRIYIADTLNKRFSIWQYLSAEYVRAHPVTQEDIGRAKEWYAAQKQKEAVAK
jgi:DNA-binding beta-propeller fold protein YncE